MPYDAEGRMVPWSGKRPAVYAERVAGQAGVAPCLCMEHGTALAGSAFGEAALKQVNLCSASGVGPSLWLQIAVLN